MELTFLKKPCTEKITAVKWTGLNKQEVTDFCDEAVLIKIESEIGEYFGYSIPTCTGNVIAKPGDYIVKLNRHKQSVFEVWSEEKLNESYFNADDINKACLDVEKETIAEKLRKLNAYITDPSKKAPYKFLNSVEQGFLLSGKEILESYLRTLLTYASYKYDDQNTEIVSLAKSIIEPDDSHKYLDDIIDGLGDEESIGLYKVIEELSKHPEWKSYTKSVRNWLINEKNRLGL